jgi:predicted O-methyltransferase YrrM
MASVNQPWLDPAVERYASEHSTQPDELQRRLIAETAERFGPRSGMQISSDEGVLIGILTRLIGARQAVEVGTFTGYSALCIARALPADGRLICCDISEEWTAVGRRYWDEAGVADRIDLRIGPAADTLRDLPSGEHLDLAFIDADKPNYATYFEELLSRLRPGGIILADNTLWSGRAVDPEPDDANGVAIAAFNDALTHDPRVDVVLLTIRDGVTLARKR